MTSSSNFPRQGDNSCQNCKAITGKTEFALKFEKQKFGSYCEELFAKLL